MIPGLALSSDLLALLDLLFLCAFLGVGSTLMLVTLIHRQRVRDVVLSWLRPHHTPAWIAALALSAVLVLVCMTLQQGHTAQAVRLAGYAVGSAFFFVVALLSGTTLATRHALIKNVNRRWQPGSSDVQMLPWQAVRDYFVRETKRGAYRYVFFFVKNGQRARFEVVVPPAYAKDFGRLVGRQVDRRIERTASPSIPEDRKRLGR